MADLRERIEAMAVEADAIGRDEVFAYGLAVARMVLEECEKAADSKGLAYEREAALAMKQEDHVYAAGAHFGAVIAYTQRSAIRDIRATLEDK